MHCEAREALLDPSASDLADRRYRALQGLLGSPEIALETVETLERMSPDPVNKPALVSWLSEGVALNERRFEIRTALRCLARVVRPRSYLEIGTRRGWSLAQVLAEAPDVSAWSVDMWMAGYGNVENPGPDFVRAELSRAVPAFRGQLSFLNGNSHDLLPFFLGGMDPEPGRPETFELARAGENRPRMFDLVTVDGDHTALGAWWDLFDVFGHVAIGGAVVFDDLVDRSDELYGARAETRYPHLRPELPVSKPSLLELWNHVKSAADNFSFIESLDASPPVAIAIRMH